jgi:hypothetical protein
MTEKQIIERLMLKVEEMRQAQRQYFKNKDRINLKVSIAKEENVDAFMRQLKKNGYNPDNQQTETPTQNNLF